MPLPVIADAFLVTQHLSIAAGRHGFVNRICVHDTLSGQTPSAVAGAVASAYATAIMPLLSTSITEGVTDVLPLDGVSSTQTFVTDSAGTVGGYGGGTDVPATTCAVWSLQTGHRGRSKRGRMYLPGTRSTMPVAIEANAINPAFVTSWQIGANAFLGHLNGTAPAHLALMVLSRHLSSVQAVVNIRMDTNLGVQRRRFEAVARH
jgi:hypothetical protein